jgi:hypothetical protein
MCQISIMLNGVCLILYMILWLYWSIGLLAYWPIGLWLCWSVGLLVYVVLVSWSMILWFYGSIGQFVSIHIEHRQYLFICGCGFPHHIFLPIRSILLLAIQ